MSSWTYIFGTIKVSPCGATQPEKEYVLKSILDHLPKVTGSEENMKVYINKVDGFTTSSRYDEFSNRSNLGKGRYGSFEIQNDYLITINASLRGNEFNKTLIEFSKWLCRLSKRMLVIEILVNLRGYNKEFLFSDSSPYHQMYDRSWMKRLLENWYEGINNVWD